jgi:hypothetical protein
MLRRLCFGLSIVMTACLATVTSASGGPSTATPISWAMVGAGATPPAADVILANCGGVSAGMWVRGSGTWTFFSPTGKAGNIQSMASGIAVDSRGNTYRWNYHQSVQPIGDGSHSRVVDDFVLSGRGPAAGIHSHFIAIIEGTDIEETQSFELLHLLGDPFNCDPL